MDEKMKEYLNLIIDIHGDSTFGVHGSTLNTHEQVESLKCWGCDGEGHSKWSENWKRHFEHKEDCSYLKLMGMIERKVV